MIPCWEEGWSHGTTFQDTLTASRKTFLSTARLAPFPLQIQRDAQLLSPFPSGVTATVTSACIAVVDCPLWSPQPNSFSLDQHSLSQSLSPPSNHPHNCAHSPPEASQLELCSLPTKLSGPRVSPFHPHTTPTRQVLH